MDSRPIISAAEAVQRMIEGVAIEDLVIEEAVVLEVEDFNGAINI